MKRKIQTARPDKKQKENKISIKIGYASCAAAEISGDAVISCGLPGGSRALILSDGMGKGINAAAGSRLVVRRLRRNLKEGMTVARAIKEVNRYMIRQTIREDFATVDLTIIDPTACRAKFYKMGAATSFLVRGRKVRRISEETLPVGIVPHLRLTHISAALKPGDIVVMVSDGITESDRNDMEAQWLLPIIWSLEYDEYSNSQPLIIYWKQKFLKCFRFYILHLLLKRCYCLYSNLKYVRWHILR